MEVPPAYGQMPKKKSKVGWIIAIILGCIACCCGGPVLFGLSVFNKSKSMIGCIVSFHDVAAGLRKYADEHKGVLPKADTWQDDIRKNYQQSMTASTENPFGPSMAADGDWSCVDGDGKRSGIAFNTEVAGKKLDSIGDQVSTIMIFETEKVEKNQHAKFVQPDFQASPKIVFSQPRGWIVANVEGQTGLIGQNGQFKPMAVTGRTGSSIQIETSSGPAKPSPDKAGSKKPGSDKTDGNMDEDTAKTPDTKPTKK